MAKAQLLKDFTWKYTSLPLISHWPKSVTWPHPNERGGEVKFYFELKGNQKYLVDSANNSHTTAHEYSQ